MTKPAITVEGLSKAYRIGLKEEVPDSLVGAVTAFVRKPLAGFQRLRRMDTFSDRDGDADDLVWALKDVSFDVAEGEVVGIIGRNGAGKSTLLKILSRITEPTRGRAVIRGRVSSLLEVGTGFHPELTGRENVYMNGTILGMTKREIDRKFDEIVAFSGVEKFLDTPTKRYSSGMQVRLAFAVAAHLEPEILIVDEVLAVGDAEFQKKCLGKMQDVARGGRTVLFVSHNMAAVEGLCARAVELRNGVLASCGSTKDVLAEYYGVTFEANDRMSEGLLHSSTHVRRAVLMDSDGRSTTYSPLGSPLDLRITISSARPLDACSVSIGLNTIAGERMLSLAMPDHHRFPVPSNVPSEVRLNVPVLPLPPGAYHFKIAVLERGRVLEVLEPVLPFTVTDAIVAGSGKGFDRGRCYAHGEWSTHTRVLEHSHR